MKWAFSVLVILLSLFLNACGGDDDFNRRFVDPSQVRFVNLVPNAPTLTSFLCPIKWIAHCERRQF